MKDSKTKKRTKTWVQGPMGGSGLGFKDQGKNMSLGPKTKEKAWAKMVYMAP